MFFPRQNPAALECWLRRLACCLAAFFVLLFLFVALRRLHYPFELDRMESGVMTSVWRIRHGYALYSPPTMEWVPFLYAPLYFYLSAWLSHLTGLDYSTLRLISVLATLGSFATIYAFVFRETRRHTAAVLAVGVFASLYDVCLGWYDIARVDSLSVFLFLLALYATRWANPLVAAIVWLLAFHAKQTFLPFGVLAFLPLWRKPRRMVTGIASFVLLAGLSVFLLNHATAGWYSRYAFGTTRQLAFIPRNAILFLPVDIVGPLPAVAALVLFAALLSPPRLRSPSTAFFGFLTVILLGAVGFVRAHSGANINAVIPAYAWLAVLAGLSIHRILTWLGSPPAALNARSAQLAACALWLALGAQLLAHIYQPGRWVPSRASLAYRNVLLDAVRNTPGDVWLVDHTYDGILAGKPLHPDWDALDAVLALPDSPVVADFNRAIAEHRYAAILLDYPAETYQPEGSLNGPAIQSSYGLRARSPGADQPNAVSQPQLTLLPCADMGAPIAMLPPGTFEDTSACGTQPMARP
jgi:hypothetical protein